MRHLFRNSVVSAIFIGPLLFSAPAASAAEGAAPASAKSVWDVSLGLGGAAVPTFEGSDRYKVLPLPIISVTYRDMISFDINGLNAYWRRGGLKLGGGLTFDGGRKDDNNDDIFESGDSRLKGLGDIDSVLGLRAFALYHVGLLDLGASVTKFTGSQNHGVLADVGFGLPYPLTKRLTFTPHLGATWASGNYMQTYFGVTPTQAANSSFTQFSAKSGIKDVDASLSFDYQYSKHWFGSAHLDVKKLTGDAADSPISLSDTQLSVLMMVGYHF